MIQNPVIKHSTRKTVLDLTDNEKNEQFTKIRLFPEKDAGLMT